MAIFTAIATAIGIAAGFWTTAFVTVASIATSIGLSYIAKALAGNPNQTTTPTTSGVQGALQSGADTPRSFNLGYSVTAGSLVYANTWGNAGNTPNSYITQVIALSDLPGGSLVEFWVNGEKCTISGADGGMGVPVTEYNKFYPGVGAVDHLWVRYYDGTQTTADAFLVATVSSTDRPYPSTRVGTGVAYVIVTAMVDDTLFSGFPTFKFAVSGAKLYDPTKDSTNGGTGSHRWSDPTTWGGDGDNLLVVQVYNVLRGIYYGGKWLYGLQRMTAARLPATNWNVQIDKCRATITGTAGPEPTYRTGGQVSVNVQTVQTIEALLSGGQGKLSEIGGFYKIHVGAPDSATFSFTDDDILSTEEQKFEPFFGLADSVNGIQATYPSPAEGWNMKPAPAYPPIDSDLAAELMTEDGDRRLLANPTLDFVPYDAQVQRLQKSALQEARRARRHDLTLPPAFWIVEPGDVGEWTSLRNGYVTKQFRIDGVTDRANLDVLVNLTEVDPTDYDWTHATDFTPVGTGPTIIARPSPQGVIDWFAEPYTLLGAAGEPRRPAILLSWDGSVLGVVGVQYEVRLTADASEVAKGRTDQLAAGALVITQSLLPNTAYQVRGQYLPSWPRDMLWSDWLDVTTPDVRISLIEFDEGVQNRVTTEFDAVQAQFDDLNQRMSTLTSKLAAQGWTDIKSVRSQLAARSDAAFASIDEVRTVAVDATSAIADLETAVTAEFASVGATVTEHTTAIATLDGYAAGSWGVVIDVNGKIVGAVHLDGSAASSVFDVLASTFRVSEPGVTGGASVPVFTISNVSGSPKLVWRGDMTGDGSLTTQMIAAGAITTITLDAQAVTSAKIKTGDITSASGVIGALSIKSLSMGDNSITVPAAQTLATAVGSPSVSVNVGTVTLSIDTAGLAGKSITVVAGWVGGLSYTGSGGSPGVTLQINGSNIQTVVVNNSQDSFMSLSGSSTFTASGGVDSIVVNVIWTSPATGNPALGSRTLWAMAAKR